jgi:GntR family transcriptional repressor for pyruvate dehydrogenase complex
MAEVKDVNLKEVKPRKIYEEVAEQLKKEIMSGGFGPGDKLPSVRELSESLGVSQPTVREALTTLKAMGLVEIFQGHGTFVSHYDIEEITNRINGFVLVSKEDILNLLEVRKMLEVGGAGSAAQKRTEKQLLQMENALEVMRDTISSPTEWDEADWQFHFAVAQATQNPIHTSLMESISGRTRQALAENRKKFFTTRDKLEQLLKQHIAIYGAIKNGLAADAQNLMLEHLLYVEKQLLESENHTI